MQPTGRRGAEHRAGGTLRRIADQKTPLSRPRNPAVERNVIPYPTSRLKNLEKVPEQIKA
jgi:hypothetical protein